MDRIDKAEQAICLASYYMDVRVIEALIRALQRNITVMLVSDLEETMAQRLRLVKMLLMPKVAKLLLDMIVQHKIQVKRARVLFIYSRTNKSLRSLCYAGTGIWY